MAKNNNLYLDSNHPSFSTKAVKVDLTSEEFYATGSNGGSKGFVLGNGAGVTANQITTYYGATIDGADLTAKTHYNIAIERISGSTGNAYVLY